MKDNFNQIESAVWKEIASNRLSPSHDSWHINQVIRFANILQKNHGGDLEIITVAAIMHDLGRSDPSLRGEKSIDESYREASSILEKIQYTPEKKSRVLKAIKEHDKPDMIPSTIEGRILKEADFLAGLGAWGILRIAMWAGETNEDFSQILDRLENRMQKRIASLVFPESKEWARQERLFVKYFLSRMYTQPVLDNQLFAGKYIVLEGNSGVGKDTQAQFIIDELNKIGHKTHFVSEPYRYYMEVKDNLKEKNVTWLQDPFVKRQILLGDRYSLMRDEVMPALSEGKFVISVRSYLSTLVYQCKSDEEIGEVAYLHRFVPRPDLLLLYDLDPETSLKRIVDRKGEESQYENIEDLKLHREKYLRIAKALEDHPVKIIDGSKSIDEVKAETWKTLIQTILSGSDRQI